jgi:acetyl/propionyl-CoA carboxylase alpha subunit
VDVVPRMAGLIMAGRVLVRFDETTYRVEVRDGVAALVGEPEDSAIERPAVELVGIAPGTYSVSLEGRTWRVYVAGTRDHCWLFCDGDVYEGEVVAEDAPQRTRSAAHSSLAAPMPATVVRILIARGDAVREGDTLLMLEAMKMELPIKAPRDAIVSAILCKEGELVQPGSPLLELA